MCNCAIAVLRHCCTVTQAGCGVVSLWMFFTVFAPAWCGPGTTQGGAAVVAAVAVWLWANTSYNLYRAAAASPGSGAAKDLTPWLQAEGLQSGASGRVLNLVPGSVEGTKLCKKTGLLSAEHSHFCRTCGKLVGYMDHHCPFTYNCVGLDNFAYYFSFLCYSTLGASFSLIISLPAFLGCVLDPSHRFSVIFARLAVAVGAGQPYYSTLEKSGLAAMCEDYSDNVLVCVIVALGLACVGTLFLFHTWLLWCQLTTLDRVRRELEDF
eukprot:SAG31_NODE_1586_length_7821_cov_3.086765_6_plen_266_part_00